MLERRFGPNDWSTEDDLRVEPIENTHHDANGTLERPNSGGGVDPRLHDRAMVEGAHQHQDSTHDMKA